MSDTACIDPRCNDYMWSFSDRTYSDFAEFEAAFRAYNAEVGEESLIIEDFILLEGSSLLVKFEGVPEGGDAYEAMEVQISSGSDSPLHFLDFLYKLNNLLHPYLKDADHVYYEGLTFQELREGVPVVELEQGS